MAGNCGPATCSPRFANRHSPCMAAGHAGCLSGRGRPVACSMCRGWQPRQARLAVPGPAARLSCRPGRQPRRWQVARASSGSGPEELDSNQLQTALNNAIAAEDYALASQLSARLKAAQGADGIALDWRALGVPDWLAERAEQLHYKFPTGAPPASPARATGQPQLLLPALTSAARSLPGKVWSFAPKSKAPNTARALNATLAAARQTACGCGGLTLLH